MTHRRLRVYARVFTKASEICFSGRVSKYANRLVDEAVEAWCVHEDDCTST
jgi:hypothetical protein